MNNFKEKALYFLDRRKHDKKSNLKFTGVILAIVIAIGLFFPLVSINGSLNLKNTQNESTNFPIFNPKESILEVSTFDFVSGKNLPDFKILGTSIGKIEIGKVNIYSFITAPMPELTWLNKANDTLNSGVVDFLVSDSFIKICDQYLGDFGNSIKDLGQTVYNLSNTTSDVLNKVVDMSNQLNAASKSVQSALADIEGIIDIIDIVFIVLMLMPLVAIILLVTNKGPKKLPAILLTIFTAIFVILGIGVGVANSMVNTSVANALANVNDSIDNLIYSLVPSIKGVLTSTGLIKNMVFDMQISIGCGLGWWIITISSILLTIDAYMIANVKEKSADKKTNAKKEKSTNKKQVK